jgi:hypothetical protein
MDISIDRLRDKLPVNIIPVIHVDEIDFLSSAPELNRVKEIYNSDNYTVARIDDKLLKISNNYYEIRYLLNEYLVGCKLNELRSVIPNFRMVYEIFIKDHMFIPEPDCLYLSCEHINGLPYDTIRDKSLNYILCHHMQVVLALYTASKELDFTHYDLGIWNLIIQPSETKKRRYVTPLGVRYVECADVSMIIDYEYSYVRDIECTTDKSFAINDVFTLLVSTMKLFDDERFLELTKLLSFFTNDTDRNSVFKMKNLPYDKDTSIAEYIAHFDAEFPGILKAA